MGKAKCNDCEREFNDKFIPHRLTTINGEEALENHKDRCEWTELGKKNIAKRDLLDGTTQRKVLESFIIVCQQTAKVFDCLNCKQYQIKCEWTKKQ